MADNLAEGRDGKKAMFYAGKTPWHGLGVAVDKELTAVEAIKKASLDYTVSKQEAYTKNKEGVFVPNGYFDIIREDNDAILGHVGNVFEPLQNEKAFEFMDKLVTQGQACYHTAGALGQGEKVWILVKFNGSADIAPGDSMESYLLLSNGHDGFASLDIALTSVRVVCQNTLTEALSTKVKGQFFKFKHTKNMESKVESSLADMQSGLMMVSSEFKAFVENAKILQKKQITAQELDNFLFSLEMQRANEREAMDDFKESTKYKALVEAFETSPGHDLAGKTLWGAVNAVTYFYDHEASTRMTGKYKSEQEGRLASSFFGNGAVKKEKAFNLALSSL